MANSDYVLRAGGYGFCPVGFLTADIAQLDTAIVMSGYTASIPDGVQVGKAAMIGSEIVVILSAAGDNLTIGRGCCDTVPATHTAGDAIWLFDDSIGRDTTEYAGTETIGVKVLPRTTTSAVVPIAASPPAEVIFNLRFARPYPPGLVEVNGDPWFMPGLLLNSVGNLVLTWQHRDRITQQDQLIDHMQASIGPEIGTTYRITVHKADNTVVRTMSAIAAVTWTYDWGTALGDFGVSGGLVDGYMTLTSLRDSLESFQFYRIDFQLDADPYGLGYRLGEFLGGFPP